MPSRPARPARPARPRPARTYAAVIVYLVTFGLLLLAILNWYLLPALRAAAHATPNEKRKLAAGALLVLLVILFAALAGLLLTFRVGRFFFPRRPPPREPTEYIDAWAESGKRLKMPPDEE